MDRPKYLKCKQCGIVKPFESYYVHKGKAFKWGIEKQCKSCLLDKQKKYYDRNRDAVRKRGRDYSKTHRAGNNERQRLYLKRNPWMRAYDRAKGRCTRPSAPNYKYYGGKGVRFLLTKEDVKMLWFRDKAYNMKKPSIDREDTYGDYILGNCRYIEFKENCRRKKRKGVLTDEEAKD